MVKFIPKLATFLLLLLGVPFSVQAGDRLVSEGFLTGRVVSISSVPVAEARVWMQVWSWDRKRNQHVAKRAGEASTDSTGRFRLGPLPAEFLGNQDVVIEAPGHALQYVPSFSYSIYPDAEHDLGTIVVEPGVCATGQIVDDHGRPFASSTVFYDVIRRQLGYTVNPFQAERKIELDADGRFRLEHLPIGLVSLRALLPDHALAWCELPVGPQEDLVFSSLKLEADVPIPGVVKDVLGEPVAGVRVEANTDLKSVSNEHGEFVIHHVREEAWLQVHFYKGGYPLAKYSVERKNGILTWYDIQADKEKKSQGPIVRVTLRREGWIEGEVWDEATREPVELRSITLCSVKRKPDGEVVTYGCQSSYFEQPAAGTFRVPYSSSGEYHVTVEADGYQPGEAFVKVSFPSLAASSVRIALSKASASTEKTSLGPRVKGTATRDGKTIRTGWAAVWRPRGKQNLVNAYIQRGRTTTGGPGMFRAATIRNGEFVVEVPRAGQNFYLVIDEPNHTPTLVGPLSFSALEEKVMPVETVAGGRIEGSVSNHPRGWEGYLWVVAFDDRGIVRESRVAKEGAFSIDRLPPGTYGLKVGSDACRDVEVPCRPGMREPFPSAIFSAMSDPWERAVLVEVKVGETTTGVDVPWPVELSPTSPK